jgi:polar amino acid transport system substrate-binding protein
MGRVRRAVVPVILVLCVAVVLMSAGCIAQQQTAAPQPKVTPPAIKEAGTLRAGVDLAYPPFGGTDNGQQAGLDLDVAAALAEKLGLKLVVVPVTASSAATELANGSVDVVMSVPFSAEALSNVSLAGSYASDAPGFFIATEGTAAVEPTMTMATLPPPPAMVGAQKGSEAYWKLLYELGPEAVQPYASLREAIEALAKGDVPVVAGDALVGAYIARDFPTVHFAGQMAPATLLGVAVAPENAKLGDAKREALDGLAVDGVLDAIRGKWVGSLAKLKVAASSAASEAGGPASP